ncbi:MAG: hypothetical protein ACRC8S_17170 [Fimbriiglobus sp.]
MILAILGIDPDAIAQLFLNCLATAGGFLAGYVIGMVSTILFDRFATGGKSPQGLHRVIRMIFGVVFALLVAFIVFGRGMGNGNGTGDGNGTTPSTGTGSSASTSTTPSTNPLPPIQEPPTNEETIKVSVLSGADVKEEKFYLIEKDRTPRSLDEVKNAVQQMKAKTTKKLAIEILLAPRTDRQNSGVLDLQNYALHNGMNVILPQKE